MATVELHTYYDLVQYLEDVADLDRSNVRQFRRMSHAVSDAYQRLPKEQKWVYYRQLGHFLTSAAVSTGTAVYDHTGGTFERMVTITGTTLPDWTIQGSLLLSGKVYLVEDVKSSTVFTLTPQSNPGSDVASTTYSLYRQSYPLPINCQGIYDLIDPTNSHSPVYMAPAEFLNYARGVQRSPGRSLYYTIIGSPDYLGARSIMLAPAPTSVVHYDFLYHRWPRQLRTFLHQEGTVSGTQGGTTITGVGTAWTENMEGAVIRFSDSKGQPGDTLDVNPASQERIVIDVAGATSLIIDRELTASVAGVSYTISDPLDIDAPAMYAALKALAEMKLSGHPARQVERYAFTLERAYDDELRRAKAADATAAHARKADATGGSPRMAYEVHL